MASCAFVLPLSELEMLWVHSQQNLYVSINILVLFHELTLEEKQRRWFKV